MPKSGRLADPVGRVACKDMSDSAREELKMRVLDLPGRAIGELGGEPVRHVPGEIQDICGNGRCLFRHWPEPVRIVQSIQISA